jgi:hypothetical protein
MVFDFTGTHYVYAGWTVVFESARFHRSNYRCFSRGKWANLSGCWHFCIFHCLATFFDSSTRYEFFLIELTQRLGQYSLQILSTLITGFCPGVYLELVIKPNEASNGECPASEFLPDLPNLAVISCPFAPNRKRFPTSLVTPLPNFEFPLPTTLTKTITLFDSTHFRWISFQPSKPQSAVTFWRPRLAWFLLAATEIRFLDITDTTKTIWGKF